MFAMHAAAAQGIESIHLLILVIVIFAVVLWRAMLMFFIIVMAATVLIGAVTILSGLAHLFG